MSIKKSGCGCGTIVMLWFVCFAFLRVCGITEVSWWYSIAPIWWPVWVLIQFVGIVIGMVIATVCIMGVVGYVKSRMSTEKKCYVRSDDEDRAMVIDADYEEMEDKL